jgi:bifunctional UDP-N-acetylglucosamine pyrophosphorylase/glucosamine-1-phosphate N-acetyltransferase
MKSRRAKVLHQAGGKTLVGHVVNAALALAPPERIFVVVGHQAKEVQDAIATPGVSFISQVEQKGTGDAVKSGRAVLSGLDGYLTVLYGDCPLLRVETLQRLIAQETEGTSACVLMSAIMADPTGYGRILRDARGHVVEIVEQKAGTPEQLAIREANMGIYCFRADLFWKHAGEILPNAASGEYYLTDMAAILARAGHTVEAMQIEDANEALGINDRAQLAEVDAILRERKRRAVMESGVTLVKPDTITVDADVEIGIDTVIGPFTQILGKSKIGENCQVGACSILDDATVADGAEIGAFTMVAKSAVGPGAIVGPYARLRPGNEVAATAHIGNFVELKKTRVGPGTKANHLTYLGDSEIGANVNIGAGTITCNYDGEVKHPTKIGAGTFVGSNSTLVAPIEIGEGAYTAAGSVLTETVPNDALALGRAHQVVKPDWARKRRERRAAKARPAQ